MPLDDALIKQLNDNSSAISTTLKLDNKNLTDDDAKQLAEALQNNTVVTRLSLLWNNITSAGGEALATALCVNRTLKTLDISFNELGDKGATAIANMLKENCTLKVLRLGSNGIGREGTLAFAEALKSNATLSSLSLASNQIDLPNADILLSTLEQSNYTLRNLDLLNNQFDYTTLSARLNVVLTRNQQTTLLMVSSLIEHSFSSYHTKDCLAAQSIIAGYLGFPKTFDKTKKQIASSILTLLGKNFSELFAPDVSSKIPPEIQNTLAPTPSTSKDKHLIEEQLYLSFPALKTIPHP